MATLTPPIKCQGIKTKIVPFIKRIAPTPQSLTGRWIEPFCGSAVIALNIAPHRATLSDTNLHIIRFYEDLQNGEISLDSIRSHLEAEGRLLSKGGQKHYNQIRERFNKEGNPLDFLFLNRACFNGVMRFNRRGHFNVPFCHKPERFSQAYITKIVNQTRAVQDTMNGKEWHFVAMDFRAVLDKATDEDFIYLDPPYFGRHVDYFNSWVMQDEDDLMEWLRSSPCQWALSTWHSNRYRSNEAIDFWKALGYYIQEIEHFYHVGANEGLRHSMIEAVITNFKIEIEPSPQISESSQFELSLMP